MAEQETVGDTGLLLHGLGESYAFTGFGIPQSISYGGQQKLAVHELAGGDRVVEALGRSERDLQWSGRFQGSGAEQEAHHLNYLRVLGKPLTLTWGEQKFKVYIADFVANYERSYQIPYTITLKVVDNLGLPTPDGSETDVDQEIRDAADDLKEGAQGLEGEVSMVSEFMDDIKEGVEKVGGFIDEATNTIQEVVDTVLEPVYEAIDTVEDIVEAGTEMIEEIIEPILNAQKVVGGIINDINGIAANIPFLGGILPDKLIDVNVNDLLSNTGLFDTGGKLINTENQLGNILSYLQNLRKSPRLVSAVGEATSVTVTAAGQTVTRAGGSLFQLAAEYYGDATQWTAIAEANNMTSPDFEDVKTLIIPTNPADSGGVLG